MWCKVLGIILVLCGAIGTGYKMAGMCYQRIRILQELRMVLQLLYGEVEYAGSGMSEGLQQIAERCTFWKPFLSRVAEKLQQMSGQSLGRIWEGEKQSLPGRACLKKEELLLWKEVGEHLGNVDRQTQLHTLSLYEKRLERILEEAWQEYHNQAKICRVLGVTVGIFTVVLFL